MAAKHAKAANVRFENRHAIITGGSSGIGKALAIQLASRGAHVSIIARTPATLEAAQLEIEVARLRSEQRVLALSADTSDKAQIREAINRAVEQSGSPSLLVVSAGIARPGYFEELSDDVFERAMSVNYFGALYAVRAALPAMREHAKREQGSGQIVLVSSGAALVGIYGYSAYGPSKFALRGLAETLRAELKPDGIGVSIVYPPDTDTPQLAEENKTKPPETKRITATAKTWSAQNVAREIVRGVEKQKFSIAPGLEMTLLSRWHSVVAPGLNFYFDRIVARTNSAREREE